MTIPSAHVALFVVVRFSAAFAFAVHRSLSCLLCGSVPAFHSVVRSSGASSGQASSRSDCPQRRSLAVPLSSATTQACSSTQSQCCLHARLCRSRPGWAGHGLNRQELPTSPAHAAPRLSGGACASGVLGLCTRFWSSSCRSSTSHSAHCDLPRTRRCARLRQRMGRSPSRPWPYPSSGRSPGRWRPVGFSHWSRSARPGQEEATRAQSREAFHVARHLSAYRASCALSLCSPFCVLVGAVVLLLVAEPLHTSIALMFFVVAPRYHMAFV